MTPEKLAKFLLKHIDAIEVWDRGEAEVTWKGHDAQFPGPITDYPYLKMAEDILKFVSKK